MSDAKKVTVLKRTENGKLKSLLVYNSAGDQGRLYFSDEGKLTRMVIGNESKNLVAFDRVGDQYVADPLTPGYIEGKGDRDEKGVCWRRVNNSDKTEFWLDIKDSSGKWGECLDSKTGEPNGQERCFVNAWPAGIRFQNAAGYSACQIDLSRGTFVKVKDNLYGECEIIEQETASKDTEKKTTRSLMGKGLDRYSNGLD